jgi:predicted metal-dependent phosphoesterase TrpH
VLKVDLHLHTADDPVDRIAYSSADLVDRAAALGFGALAITLHDRQLEDDRLTAYARERGITLLPAIERTVSGRHVLLINFPAAAAYAVRRLDDLAALRRHGRGLVIAPHPFFPNRSCLRSALDAYAADFDAVEWSYFWTGLADFNTRGARWAARHGKAVVGNSDLHDLRGFGRTYSLVDAAGDADAICDAIRAGRVELRTSPAPVLELADIFVRMQLRPRKRTPEGVGSDLDLCAGDPRRKDQDLTPPSSLSSATL